MKWAEVNWTEPEKFPAAKMMQCDGCGWPITAQWMDIDHAAHQFIAGSKDAPEKMGEVENCPNCGAALKVYTLDIADDGQWHYAA